jgi:N-acetylglutamate synthase-like GNAT family acetyltransferase
MNLPVDAKEICIRRIQLSDAPKVAKMLQELVQTVSTPMIERIVESDSCHTYVICDKHQLVGTGTLCIYDTATHGVVGRFEDIIITKEYRGGGWGQVLVEHLLDEAKRLGVSSLWLTSNPERVSAQKLYRKLGFTQYTTDVFTMSL